MPRAAAYTPWTSKNCLMLASTPAVRALNADCFRAVFENGRVQVRKRVEGSRTFEMREYNPTDRTQFAGRPHSEEGLLIYLHGTENENSCAKCLNSEGRFKLCVSAGGIHKGACANCVLQSVTNSCACASKTIAKLNDMKEENMGEKLRQKSTRGTVSSKRKRADAEESSDEERDGDRARLLRLADDRAAARVTASPEKARRGGIRPTRGRKGRKG